MAKQDLLTGKHILIVDDEEDILDTLSDLLSDCVVERASTFEQASKKLNSVKFDLAILDIMGVEGYDLAWWILLDVSSVIVHIFFEEARKYYDLDLLWSDAPVVYASAESNPD